MQFLALGGALRPWPKEPKGERARAFYKLSVNNCIQQFVGCRILPKRVACISRGARRTARAGAG
eukprot:15434611-Alexandrium_andersonii.AAC.1